MRVPFGAALFLATLGTALAAASSVAQPPELCNVAFSQGIRDNYETFSQQERFDFFRARLLSIQAETFQQFRERASSLGVNIPFAEGILGLTGSDEQKRQSFQQRFAEFRTSADAQTRAFNYFRSNVSVANNTLVESWRSYVDRYLETYMRLRGLGTFLEVTPYGDGSRFIAHVTVRSDQVGAHVVQAIFPDDPSVVCSAGGQRVVPGTEFSVNRFRMDCTKNPGSEIPFSITFQRGPSNEVQVPGVGSRFAEMDASIALVQESLRGMIAAFPQSCPAGWEPFTPATGRFLLGAGAGEGLTPRTAGSTSGTEQVTISVEQLPSHQHRTVEAGDDTNSEFGTTRLSRRRQGTQWSGDGLVSRTGSVGGGQPVPNMPPFLVVAFCQKI